MPPLFWVISFLGHLQHRGYHASENDVFVLIFVPGLATCLPILASVLDARSMSPREW
jgi:lipid-A-disaccharide synthase-like uncharacterized protein